MNNYAQKKTERMIQTLIALILMFVGALTVNTSAYADNNYQNSYNATIYNGSLKQNVTRILTHCGWTRVIWNTPYDYNWTGQTVVRGNSPQEILQVILKGYPLQAVFYHGNHIVLIRQRIAQ